MNPVHKEVIGLCRPWLLDPGIPIANGVFGSTEATLPCRGDVIRLNLTALGLSRR
jgi:hypothetical protein